MNIEGYISSGIIETYVLGLAGEDEIRELEQLCLQYPEVRDAVREAEASLNEYAQLHSVNPPEGMKDQIWKAIEESEEGVKPLYKEEKPKSSSFFSYLSKAAIFLILIGLPYHFYKVRQYESEISDLQREKNEIVAQNQMFRAQINEVSQELDILSDPSTRNIVLAGVEGHENKEARVYWSNTGEVFLTASGLPVLPSDKQYQLWAIVDGQPVNAGLLEQGSTTGLQKMEVIDRAEMFAITIENQGGSEQPTLDQMVVAGKEVVS